MLNIRRTFSIEQATKVVAKIGLHVIFSIQLYPPAIPMWMPPFNNRNFQRKLCFCIYFCSIMVINLNCKFHNMSNQCPHFHRRTFNVAHTLADRHEIRLGRLLCETNLPTKSRPQLHEDKWGCDQFLELLYGVNLNLNIFKYLFCSPLPSRPERGQPQVAGFVKIGIFGWWVDALLL